MNFGETAENVVFSDLSSKESQNIHILKWKPYQTKALFFW